MKNKKSVMILTVILAAVQLMTGCGKISGSEHTSSTVNEQTINRDKDEYELHLGVILGNHANQPKPNLALAEAAIYEACFTYGSVTLIVDDGDPQAVTIDIPEQAKGLSISKYQSIANDETKQIMTAAASMFAVTPEVDTLRALQLAGRALHSAETSKGKEAVKELIIVDSALATTGVLNFTKCGLTGISETEIVDKLAELQEIPNLEGVNTILYGLGDVSGMQEKLTAQNIETMKKVYTGILEAGGAQVNIKDNLPLFAEYKGDELPEVTEVPVVENIMDIGNGTEANQLFADGKVVELDEENVKFKSGKAELLKPEEAAQVLDKVVDCMKENPDLKLLVAGRTAMHGGFDYCQELSKARADVICDYMIQQGIEPERLVAVGLGFDNIFYTNDYNDDGTFNEELARKNRAVNLMSLDSEKAAMILNEQ